MARPSGWDILGLDGDPTPGVVESVEALAKEFHDFADDAERAWRNLNSFGGDTASLQWIGQTADAFKSNFGPLPGRMQKLYTSYREAGDALAAYAPKLQAAQTKADTALRQAQDAHADVQRATTTANSAAADLKTAQQNQAAVPNQQAVTDAQTAHDTAQKNLEQAKATLSALSHTAHDAYNDRISAAKECASTLHKAQSDGIHNKHWWEHVGEVLSEWGGKIAEIANELAPFLDVLALATSWIPGLDVITAGLAEADNLIALVGTGMKIVGDGMQGHWGDALMGVGMLGATYLGGKAFEKIGGNLLGRLGNKGCTRAGDPVDVVSGRMIAEEVDLELPGVMPLILGRAYNSGYQTGRLFGPGWAGSIDQRIAVNAAGIHFVGDDAETLTYPVPLDGHPVWPVEGPRRPLVWDREADEIRITDPETGWVRHFPTAHFADERGQIRDLTAVSDRNGNRIVFLRDADGTPTAVEFAHYKVAIETAAFETGPRITALRLLDGTDAGVPVKEFRYDDRGRLVGVVDSSGLPFGYEYDEADRVVAWVDRVGYRYRYFYDADGRVIRGVGDGGYLSATFQYGPGHETTVVDSLGHATCYRYDENGRIASITDPLGSTLHTEYDVDGHLLSSTDALGNRTESDFDTLGNLVRTRYADERVVEFEYDGLGQITSVRTPDGALWRQEYDERGNLLAVTDPLGATTAYEYLANGALSAFTDATGFTTRFDTDDAGLPVAVTDPLGARTETVRDAFGRIVAVRDPLGAVTANGWTVEGLPAWRVAPDGGRHEWAYDPEGRPISEADPLGGVTRFEQGPFGQTVARVDAGGSRHEFVFDTELNLVSVTNAAGATWSYTHDAAGRLISETDFIGRTLAYRHDPAGRLVERTNGVGQRITLTRDRTGRVVGRQTPDGDFGYSYDATGRALVATGPGTSVGYTRDAVGRVLGETIDGRTVEYEYDPAGRRIRRTTPAGSTTSWSYDAAGRAGGLDAGIGSLAFDFDAAGRVSGTVLSGARIAVKRDVAGRPVSLALLAGDEASEAASPVRRAWTYHADNTPIQETDSLRGTRRFQTDQLGRVTSAVADDWSESFAYDSFGNLAHAQTPDADTSGVRETHRTLTRVAGRTSYEHDAAGRLIRTVRRTLDGRRRVWQYEWDADDHLVRVTTPDDAVWRYTYDPIGRRTSKSHTAPDGETTESVLFTWDGMLMAEQHQHAPDGSASSLTWEYEPDTFRPVAQIRRSWAAGADQRVVDEAFHAIVTDLVGTPTELVGPDGAVAWAITTGVWGRAVSISGAEGVECPLRFPGQYLDDETGLHYNLHRYYDPDTASYLSPDPLGLVAAPNDHGYVPNPFTWIDPFGLYGAGGGTMCGAADLALRAKNLQKEAGWSGTTSVVRVRKLTPNADGTCEEQMWVASNKTYLPTGWKTKGSLRPDEVFIKGKGHAEETIINGLFNKQTGVQEWGIVEGGTSTGICWGNCFPDLTGNGLKVGGSQFPSSKNNSPWRMFWSP